MRARTIALIVIFGFTVRCAHLASAAPLYRLTDLGTLGGAESYAYTLNNQGVIVGDALFSASAEHHAFSYRTSTGISDLGTLGGAVSRATGINENGEIAGWSYLAGPSTNVRAFRRTADGTMLNLGTLGGFSYGADINASSQVVGWSRRTDPNTDYPVLFSNGTVTDLGSLGGTGGQAWGINDAGDIIGYAYLSGNVNYRAFRYRNGTMTNLGTLGGSKSLANDINNSGQIVGDANTANNAARHAFLYTNGAMIDLGTLGKKDSIASGLNDFGQVVGWTAQDGLFESMIYKDGVTSYLKPLVDESAIGWTLNLAYDINNAGEIVGAGRSPSGRYRAFLLSPIPEPSAAFGGALILAMLGRRERKRAETGAPEGDGSTRR